MLKKFEKIPKFNFCQKGCGPATPLRVTKNAQGIKINKVHPPHFRLFGYSDNDTLIAC